MMVHASGELCLGSRITRLQNFKIAKLDYKIAIPQAGQELHDLLRSKRAKVLTKNKV